MQGHSKEFAEYVKFGQFIGPLTKRGQDMSDLLTAFTMFEDNGLIDPALWQRDDEHNTDEETT